MSIQYGIFGIGSNEDTTVYTKTEPYKDCLVEQVNYTIEFDDKDIIVSIKGLDSTSLVWAGSLNLMLSQAD